MNFNINLKVQLTCLALISSVFFTGCSQDKKNPKANDIAADIMRFQWSQSASTTSQIKVINQFGEPIAAAKILIGEAEGIPFRDNFIETDQNGKVVISKDWTAPAHVTVEASGYIRQTLLNQKPGNLILKLSPSYLATRAEVKGQVTNLPIVNGDKLIDFGLVMPALTRADILNFSLDQVISPYTDILTVAGQQAPLPSNVSLPSQKENYIFNLTISKPIYRLLTPTLGPKRFFAARGRFPFKEVVNELKNGKPFYEVLNYFSILGGGIRDITLLSQSTNLDIPGTELDFKNTIQVQSAVAQADEVLVVLAASEISGTMIPTDVKKSTGTPTMTLTSMADKPVFIVSVIKKQSEFMANAPGADRLSASIKAFNANEKQVLLPLVQNPSITTTNGYQINLPNAPTTTGVFEIGTSLAISDLSESQNGDTKITTANRRWEILGFGWSTKLQLPRWPLASTSAKQRIEVNFIGSTTTESVNLDDSLIQAATHVSHASTDF